MKDGEQNQTKSMVMTFYNYAQRRGRLLSAALAVTRASTPAFSALYIITALLLLFFWRGVLILYLAVPAAALVVGLSTRRLIRRKRPCTKYGLTTEYSIKSSFSCPSNHAVCTCAVSFACMYVNLWFGLAVLAAAVFSCMCRIFLALHYPSDIMVGYAIGGLVALVGYSIIPALL